MLTGKNTVRIKEGCRHGLMDEKYVLDAPTGNPGKYAVAGDTITVTDQELRDFGDKFIVLDPVSAALSKPNGSAANEQETIERMAAELKSERAAHKKTATELTAARKAMSIAPAKPPNRRGRPKKVAVTKEA